MSGLNPCKIPKAVTINGVRCVVRQETNEALSELYKEDGGEPNGFFYGRFDSLRAEILVNKDLPALCKWRSFVHELIHAIQDASGQQLDDATTRAYETAMAWVLNRSNWEY